MYALPANMFAITHAHHIAKMLPGSHDDNGALFNSRDMVTFICAELRALKK